MIRGEGNFYYRKQSKCCNISEVHVKVRLRWFGADLVKV